MFSGPQLMDAAAVSVMQLSARGVRTRESASTAIADVDKVP